MENLGKKRKGGDLLALSRKDPTSRELTLSHLSLNDYSRGRKKCKGIVVTDNVGPRKSLVPGVVTAPPCGNACLDAPGRGLKRKIGCIDSALKLRRKKKIDQEYELGEIIGKGKFGSVMFCRKKVSGEQFACKTLRKGEESVHREVEIMQHLSGHPGVVTLKAVYEDVESFHLVMELCPGGRLLDQMAKEGQYSEHRAANLIKELMLIIKYCHEMGVVHRDIKPENILLSTTGRIKLADFGLAVRISDGQSLMGVVGSPAYVAPEVLLGDYSEKVDVWSAGILLHALLVGFLPFQGDSLKTVFDAIKKENLDFRGGVWESISQSARDLMCRMLMRDVSMRLTADEVLGHPWISFYTEPAIKRLTIMPSSHKNHLKVTSGESAASATGHLNDDSRTILYTHSSAKTLEGEEDYDLVDILAAAISHVRISEPKRIRIWNPTSPIQQECSSNMKASSLCTAF